MLSPKQIAAMRSHLHVIDTILNTAAKTNNPERKSTQRKPRTSRREPPSVPYKDFRKLVDGKLSLLYDMNLDERVLGQTTTVVKQGKIQGIRKKKRRRVTGNI